MYRRPSGFYKYFSSACNINTNGSHNTWFIFILSYTILIGPNHSNSILTGTLQQLFFFFFFSKFYQLLNIILIHGKAILRLPPNLSNWLKIGKYTDRLYLMYMQNKHRARWYFTRMKTETTIKYILIGWNKTLSWKQLHNYVYTSIVISKCI